jgi:site-specific DNA-cytosine methylase
VTTTANPVRLVAQTGSGMRGGKPKPFRSIDEPAYTIHGGSREGEGGGIRHRLEYADGTSRAMTVAEYGAMQSFPHDYPWHGGVCIARLQAGNAVPPSPRPARPRASSPGRPDRDR